jgi:PhnB protein
MKILPYLGFDGTCTEAFKFYEQVLDGRIEFLMTYGDSPAGAETPAEHRDRVMHVRLVAGDSVLLGADAPPGSNATPQGFSLLIAPDSTEEADRIFTALAEGGRTTMPLGPTFWAERFGMLVDRFGTPWLVNYEGAVVLPAGR